MDNSRDGKPRSINIWLDSLRSTAGTARSMTEAEQAAAAQKDDAILAVLAKLAMIYWRPDFTPGQAKHLYAQYLDDLREFAFADIVEAAQKYRRDAANKFFPLPGQLRGLILAVPAWDVISAKDHSAQRHGAAEREMQAMAALVQAKGALTDGR